MTHDTFTVPKDLREIYDEKVEGGDLPIEEFVENQLLPAFKSIELSGSLRSDQVTEIKAMRIGISTQNGLYLKLKGLDIDDTNDALNLLKLQIEEKLERTDKILESVTLKMGNTATSIVTIAEETSPAPNYTLGSDDYPAGPGGNYYIRKASDRWITRHTTLTDYLSETIAGSKDSTGLKSYLGESGEILLISSKNTVRLRPSLGRTLINRRKIPWVVDNTVAVSLMIVPIEKYFPPFYFKVPTRQHFLTYLNAEKDNSLMIVDSLREGVNRSGKSYLVAELSKTLENVVVSGNEINKLVMREKAFCYEGVFKDFIIIIMFPDIQDSEENEAERDLAELVGLVDSFHPVTFLDPSQKLRELQETSDSNFQHSIAQARNEIFVGQYAVVMAQISTLRPEDPSDRLKIMDLLKPFEALADELKMHEDEGWQQEMTEQWTILWESYHAAEQGNATDFIESVKRLQEEWNTPEEESTQ